MRDFSRGCPFSPSIVTATYSARLKIGLPVGRALRELGFQSVLLNYVSKVLASWSLLPSLRTASPSLPVPDAGAVRHAGVRRRAGGHPHGPF